VRFEPILKANLSGPQRRVHTLRVEASTIVAPDLVRAQLDLQRERLQDAKDAEEGKQRLFKNEGKRGLEHAAGKHADERLDDCIVCQSEIDAEEREAADGAAAADSDTDAGVTSIKKPRKRTAKSQ